MDTTITGGGGIRIENSSPRLKDLKILNSVANVGGGGISCEACDSRITDVVIANNSVTGIGGGMRMFNGSNPELLGVTVSNNTSTLNGGGIAYEGFRRLPSSRDCTGLPFLVTVLLRCWWRHLPLFLHRDGYALFHSRQRSQS